MKLIDKLLETPGKTWLSYLLLYLPVGFLMNQVGIWSGIARFAHWWQVLTCYGLYMIPVSLLVRHLKFHEQYLWGLFAMCLLEFGGYALGSSEALGIVEIGRTVIIKNNLLAEMVNVKNFSLAMAVFFGLYIPAGNTAVDWAEAKLFQRHLRSSSLIPEEI